MHDLLFRKYGIIDGHFGLCAYKHLPVFFQHYHDRVRSCFHLFCDLNADPDTSPFPRIDIYLIILQFPQKIRIYAGICSQIIIIHDRSAGSSHRNRFHLTHMNLVFQL